MRELNHNQKSIDHNLKILFKNKITSNLDSVNIKRKGIDPFDLFLFFFLSQVKRARDSI